MRKLKTKIDSLLKSLKLKKIRKLQKQLDGFIQQLIKKGVINQALLGFIRDIKPREKQIEACGKILKRKDLTATDFYEISKVIEDEVLRTEAQEKYVTMASDDDLNYTIKYEEDALQEMALEELCERIQKGVIKISQARQNLIKIFEDVPKYRIRMWDILKYLEPADKELRYLLDLPFIDTLPDLRGKIERLIRKRPKAKDYNSKIIAKIQKIIGELTKLKEGQ